MKMNRIIIAAAIGSTVALSGCAPALSSLSSLSSGFGDNQKAAQVTPGVAVDVTPVGSVGGSFLSGTQPGDDIIVKTFTNPPQMLSIVQPIKTGAAAITAGERVGVTTRDGNTRVIPIPDYTPAKPHN